MAGERSRYPLSCRLDRAAESFWEEALLHRRSLSSGGDEGWFPPVGLFALLALLTSNPDHGLVKVGF